MTTIDQILAEKLASWYVGEWPLGNFFLCLIALLLALFLCGIIGMERERRGRSAGLRTHLLVGVGSCIIMIISIYGFPKISLDGNTFLSRDIARLAAGVITGVGFLGAGAIIHRNSGTRGLTTAATIWIAMAIGLACGSMNFILATAGTFLIFVVLVVFRKLEKRVQRYAPCLIVRSKGGSPIVTTLLEASRKYSCAVQDLRVDMLDNGEIEVTFLVLANNPQFQPTEFVSHLEGLPDILQVEVLNAHKD